jgi:AcrR family transcriptional regulator
MQVTRQQLYEQIWDKPLAVLAETYGLTGNGLAKVCDRLAIPRPPRAHWTLAPESRQAPPPLGDPPVGLGDVVELGERRSRRPATPRVRMDAAARRDQLLQMARRIAEDEGLSAVTMRRLAAEADISETQVHNCFGARIDMLIELAREEVRQLESGRRESVDRNGDRRTRIVLSTVAYLHEAAERGPVLQMLLRIPEVKAALKGEREARDTQSRSRTVDLLAASGRMDRETALASTSSLAALTLRAGGIVSARRAPFPLVETLCLAMLMAGVRSDEKMAWPHEKGADKD